MRTIEQYWNDFEQRGFVRTESPGKICYSVPPESGTGGFEIWGDITSAPVCITDITLKKPMSILEYTDERYLQFGQFYSGETDIYQKKSELSPAEHGLNIYANQLPLLGYKRIAAGIRGVDAGMCLRAKFFDELPFPLPEDFWETAAAVLNPAAIALPELTAICNQLRDCRLTGLELSVFSLGKAYEALALILHYVYGQKRKAPLHLSAQDRKALETVRAILHQRLSSPPRIAELAAAVGLNQQKLMTGFQFLNGMTIYSYLKELRMKRAAEMLQQTELPVAEIALSVGYHGDGHFQKAFKDIYGVPPRALRKELHDL